MGIGSCWPDAVASAVQTQCPSCGAAFRVAPSQLARRRGWVRCGRCHAAFDGLARLGDEPPGVHVVRLAVAGESGPAKVEDRLAPMVPLAKTSGVSTPSLEPWQRGRGGRLLRLAAGLFNLTLALGLALGLVLQWALLAREPLGAWWPPAVGLLSPICERTACPPAENRIAERIERPFFVESQLLWSDPTRPDVLGVHLTFRHRAPWPLPEPHWRLTLTGGDVGTRQRVLPPEHPTAERWAWIEPNELRHRELQIEPTAVEAAQLHVEPL